MIYVLTQNENGRAVVKARSRFAWLIQRRQEALARAGIQTDFATVTTDPQEIMNICTHRDIVIAQRNTAIEALSSLVARDGDGQWTTVHPEDTPVSADAQALLAELYT